MTLTTANSVRIVPTDPNRVWVVSLRSEGEQQIADVPTSTNRGESFTTSSLPLEPEEIRAYLLEAGSPVVSLR